jgi:hypothetical protein
MLHDGIQLVEEAMQPVLNNYLGSNDKLHFQRCSWNLTASECETTFNRSNNKVFVSIFNPTIKRRELIRIKSSNRN